MNKQDQDEQAAKNDILRASARLFEIRAARMSGHAQNVRLGADHAKADMRDYCGETHPIAGCTLVLRFGTDRWEAASYAPGYEPVGREGMISNFFSRPLGSVGIAVESFIRNGGTWKPDFARMAEAERDYSVGISL
jgi:hypothetical protein